MMIIPPVLFLTFAGFLPNDCDAMHRFEVKGAPTVYPEDSGTIVVTSRRGLQFKSDFMTEVEGHTEPYFLNEVREETFATYRACFITFPYFLHESSDIFSQTAENQGYIETTYVPKSVEVKALNIEYYEFERNWHVYDLNHRPPHPTSKEFGRLYITIPKTHQVLHKLFKERRAPAGVDYDKVRTEALLEIHDRHKAQIKALEALPSSRWL